MREDQMSKLDRGLVTFSAVGARGGGKPTQILTDQLTLYQIMRITSLLPPLDFQTFLRPCHICLLGHGMPPGDIQYTSRHEF